MSTGRFAVDRGIMTNKQFLSNADRYAAVWLISQAAWKDTTVTVSGAKIHIARGQIAIPIRQIAEAWECPRSTAHNRLARFEKNGFCKIEAWTLNGTPSGTLNGTPWKNVCNIITICKYNDFQYGASDGADRSRTPNGTLDGTLNGTEEVRRIKEEEELSNPARARAREGTRISEEWKPNEKNILAALGKGFTHDQITDIGEAFREWWLSATRGSKKTSSGWDRAWSGWLANEIKFHGSPSERSNRTGKTQTGRGRPDDGGVINTMRGVLVKGDIEF